MKKKILLGLATFWAVIFLTTVTVKADTTFAGNLSGAQEVPANASTAKGFGVVTLTNNETQVYVSLTFSGLGSNQTAAHIHSPGAPGVIAPVILNIGSTGATGGVFIPLTFSVTPTQVAGLKAGLWYFDVHSANFPDGEIRGQIKPANKAVDFDGDSRADISVFRPNNGTWYRLDSVNGAFRANQFGANGDIVAPGDFDGDGKTDLNVWRNGVFYTLRSADNTFNAVAFGIDTDDPQACADYDGDGKADYTVYRTGTPSFYYILGSTRGFFAVAFGSANDFSIVADWDGDRISDPSVYRPSNATYYGLKSSNNQLYAQNFGVYITDEVTTGDVDADGKSDPLVYRFSGAQPGTWYWIGSTSGFAGQGFGLGTDRAVPADYDGDGKTDLAVYRSPGQWFVQRSSNSAFSSTTFGANNDFPIPVYLTR